MHGKISRCEGRSFAAALRREEESEAHLPATVGRANCRTLRKRPREEAAARRQQKIPDGPLLEKHRPLWRARVSLSGTDQRDLFSFRWTRLQPRFPIREGCDASPPCEHRRGRWRPKSPCSVAAGRPDALEDEHWRPRSRKTILSRN